MKRRKTVPIKERLEKHVFYSPDGCWYWTSAVRNGYGSITIDGAAHIAHRVSYRIFKGEPGDLLVCHSCDNKLCINPDHLFLGTQRENIRDMINKKRSRFAFTIEQLALMSQLKSKGESNQEIAGRFNVHVESVRRAIKRVDNIKAALFPAEI